MTAMKTSSARRQRGASLFVALVMMLAITMIGLAGANLSTSEERMARNSHDSALAFQAGRLVMLERAKVVAAADRLNIAIVGLDSGLPPAPLRP